MAKSIPWTPYVKQCKEAGTYFADGVVQSHPYKEPQRQLLREEQLIKEKELEHQETMRKEKEHRESIQLQNFENLLDTIIFEDLDEPPHYF